MDTLQKLRESLADRNEAWKWDFSFMTREDLEEMVIKLFRIVEIMGEAGELAEVVKKMARSHIKADGKGGIEESVAMENIEEEVGDVLISLDLFASEMGIDLKEAIVKKFNKTSEKYGLKQRIEL